MKPAALLGFLRFSDCLGTVGNAQLLFFLCCCSRLLFSAAATLVLLDCKTAALLNWLYLVINAAVCNVQRSGHLIGSSIYWGGTRWCSRALNAYSGINSREQLFLLSRMMRDWEQGSCFNGKTPGVSHLRCVRLPSTTNKYDPNSWTQVIKYRLIQSSTINNTNLMSWGVYVKGNPWKPPRFHELYI